MTQTRARKSLARARTDSGRTKNLTSLVSTMSQESLAKVGVAVASGMAGVASVRGSLARTKAPTFGKAGKTLPALTRGVTAVSGPTLNVAAGAGGGGEALAPQAGDSPSSRMRSRALA